MYASKLHIVTLREDPADAEIASHRLMARAGFIYKVSSGFYAYNALLLRSLRKIKEIVRQEHAAVGAVEMEFPLLQPQDLWVQSKRWDVYQASGTMFTTKDRREAIYALSPTAEEVVTDYVRTTARSYRQLPLIVYQIHTKFRDEIRPRFGLLRVKEFVMKDAYSYDVDEEGLSRSFEVMKQVYVNIFRRLGLEAFYVEADPGDIGGTGSLEFMIAAAQGEDQVLIEGDNAYAANVEKATSMLAPHPTAKDELIPKHVEATPNIRTCEELASFFPKVPVAHMVKSLLYKAVHRDREELWLAMIRGDQEVNEVKLRNHTGGLALTMLNDEEIERHTGAKQGFAGPIALPPVFRIVADESVRDMRNFLCGVNQTDCHALDVNFGRDFPEPSFVDIRLAREGDAGPVNGAPLKSHRGIEVGHIFKLGTKYSAAMSALFVDKDGQQKPYLMGCYGIGVSRILAAAVEQNCDQYGIVWPAAIAPFEVVVACLSPQDDNAAKAAAKIYGDLKKEGIDVLYDDRDVSAGVRFADLELMGFPYAVFVGRAWKQDKLVEVRTRRGKIAQNMTPKDAVQFLSDKIAESKQIAKLHEEVL